MEIKCNSRGMSPGTPAKLNIFLRATDVDDYDRSLPKVGKFIVPCSKMGAAKPEGSAAMQQSG